MIECEIAAVLDINKKVQKIMKILGLQSENAVEVSQQQEFFKTIGNALSKILLYLGEEQSQKIGEDVKKEDSPYHSIERQLQRQEHLNRLLIKKELQFKQYQKCLLDELNDERLKGKELQSQLSKAQDRILTKDLEIIHSSNEKKLVRKAKEIFNIETLNERKTDTLKPKQVPHHIRRKSDQLTKRSSTANHKKKGSNLKK